LKYWLNQWMWAGLDWLFPPVCGGCNQAGYRWCPDCQKQVLTLPEPVCRTCGIPIFRPGQCPTCRSSPPKYKLLRSWLVFEGPIRNALHKLKYRRNMALGEALAKNLAEYSIKLGWPVELVVPVPLGKERTKERGYNQVGLVAMPLAAINHWQYKPQALVRTRDTLTQVGLSIVERRENVSGAFQGDPAIVLGSKILLVDDVATTGATLSSCAAALLDAGANAVYALTLARALPHHGLNIV
jgi:competence protein ComFC